MHAGLSRDNDAFAPQAVCVLRGEKPDWDTAKKVLGEPNFMRSLFEFDKDNIPDSVIRKLRRYVVRCKAGVRMPV